MLRIAFVRWSSGPVLSMICCFSKQEVPTDKLLLLYYPPSMAHHSWDHSVYACARAREALAEVRRCLRSLYPRYVVGSKFLVGLGVGLAGLLLLGGWAWLLATKESAGFAVRWLLPLAGAILFLFGWIRFRGFRRRSHLWKNKGKAVAAEELRAIDEAIAAMPDDPTAEQAATVLRRQCPEVLSEITFHGTYFRAFTYLDFVMYPQLRHPAKREELPDKHSLNRDAYYVGDIVYDGWRMFQKGQRELADPRFAGSGGRRGVI